jgi:hypothetical protein
MVWGWGGVGNLQTPHNNKDLGVVLLNGASGGPSAGLLLGQGCEIQAIQKVPR